ncbi:hypothetical protein [Luteolibacter sp. LG18]|uniref:hypothetical protein n=1 Tax=Luteolibacter sp. LG18 TaxID=2819286 RepID=UPI0030C6FC05
MSNYYATARSNYFAVTDETAFRQWAEAAGLKVLTPTAIAKVSQDIPRFGITPDEDSDWGGWPTTFLNPDTGNEEDIDVHQQLAAHLAEGEVAVLMEIGSEKLRYLTGTAIAINHQGETVNVDLESIYAAAAHLGWTVTPAEF